jgi:hypothetical protein
VARYGDANTVSLATFGMLFGGAAMIADPRTLTFSAFANQGMSLAAVLDQPGVMVMVDIGPASVPASVLSIRADDLHTPTPRGGPTRTRTATPTSGGSETPIPTATGAQQASATPTGGGGGTPSPAATVLTPTPSPTTGSAQPCRGDCNLDHAVTVDELVRAVNVALGSFPIDRCQAADADSSTTVTVNELVAAVLNALHGCD